MAQHAEEICSRNDFFCPDILRLPEEIKKSKRFLHRAVDFLRQSWFLGRWGVRAAVPAGGERGERRNPRA
jgi:hypothetical protein